MLPRGRAPPQHSGAGGRRRRAQRGLPANVGLQVLQFRHVHSQLSPCRQQLPQLEDTKGGGTWTGVWAMHIKLEGRHCPLPAWRRLPAAPKKGGGGGGGGLMCTAGHGRAWRGTAREGEARPRHLGSAASDSRSCQDCEAGVKGQPRRQHRKQASGGCREAWAPACCHRSRERQPPTNQPFLPRSGPGWTPRTAAASPRRDQSVPAWVVVVGGWVVGWGGVGWGAGGGGGRGGQGPWAGATMCMFRAAVPLLRPSLWGRRT